jgi:hypothetical protein
MLPNHLSLQSLPTIFLNDPSQLIWITLLLRFRPKYQKTSKWGILYSIENSAFFYFHNFWCCNGIALFYHAIRWMHWRKWTPLFVHQMESLLVILKMVNKLSRFLEEWSITLVLVGTLPFTIPARSTASDRPRCNVLVNRICLQWANWQSLFWWRTIQCFQLANR